MTEKLILGENNLRFDEAVDFVLRRHDRREIAFSESSEKRGQATQKHLYDFLEKGVPVYGVNTGFGDSCFRVIPLEKSATLQKNLIAYLLCGTGKKIPREAVRATCFFRLQSLSRGYSGVSTELRDRLKIFLENDWLPVIPSQGSLGASGDLIPLAYLAQVLQGEGELETPEGVFPATEFLNSHGIAPYVLKPKEGLALVNGTSAMTGMAFLNLVDAENLVDLALIATSWLVLALRGRPEAFSPLVNEIAKEFPGQSFAAKTIAGLLAAEDHAVTPLPEIGIADQETAALIQDRYSLRCTPQVLGPVLDTLTLVRNWIEKEMNGVSDNPLISESGEMALGGNFYGGYLSQGMDYLKISLAHVADLIDRQLMTVIDEKSNRGLPPNLANWPGIPKEDHFLHHGLKGLHQAVNALTSEILAKATPNGIFSRSSESHNQDKVSLGMSAAMQCGEMLDSLYTSMALYLTCLTQALDLRGLILSGRQSQALYSTVRKQIPFITEDSSQGHSIEALTSTLRALGREKGSFLG